ncbi:MULTISPECIES: hypothetical protein [Halorussus]|uniref:hypothetical protein n=1 Tax=Halorussus TaxID=1070314 RepID=UPI000E213D7B|nr:MULTISPECIES: hypothetical protein [Halorussus]NHN61341.1 hypothetical protein [Halorussus sp. JP-T4]
MRHTLHTTELPTRTTLRDAAARALAATGRSAERAAVLVAAAAAFAVGTAAAAVLLGVVVTNLPAGPSALLGLPALLGATATVVGAVAALPLVALAAARATLRGLDRLA